jgi:hypothetical protein
MVAAFFAVASDDADDDTLDGVVWALNPFGLNNNQIGEFSILGVEHSNIEPIIDAAYGAQAPSTHTLAILEREVDVRMLIQQSTFTIHSTPQPIETISGAETFTRKFVIPAEFKRQIWRQLDSIGIQEDSLFPDLEHLARRLAQLRFK